MGRSLSCTSPLIFIFHRKMRYDTNEMCAKNIKKFNFDADPLMRSKLLFRCSPIETWPNESKYRIRGKLFPN